MAHSLAAMVQRSGIYAYQIKESTDQKCIIEFYQNGQILGESEFSWADAERAGLPKFNEQYKRYPKAMLYNRAMAQGVRMYCPSVSFGPIYEMTEIEDIAAHEDNMPDMPDIPVQALKPEQEPKPRGESPNNKQLGLLYGLLKQHGVRDGSKSNLVARIFPDGITKREASDAISLLKEKGQLFGTWINSYITLLVEEEKEDKRQVAAWMKEHFGTNNPSGITKEQQHELFAWITGDFGDIPEVQADQLAETEQPEPTPASEPNASNWALLVAQICQGAGVTLDDLTSWAIDRFAPESNYDDMTQLGADAFNQLRGMDLDTIKESVATYAKDDGDRFV